MPTAQPGIDPFHEMSQVRLPGVRARGPMPQLWLRLLAHTVGRRPGITPQNIVNHFTSVDTLGCIGRAGGASASGRFVVPGRGEGFRARSRFRQLAARSPASDCRRAGAALRGSAAVQRRDFRRRAAHHQAVPAPGPARRASRDARCAAAQQRLDTGSEARS